MEPKDGDTEIRLPATMDVSGGRFTVTKEKLLMSAGLLLIGVIFSIACLIVAAGSAKIVAPIVTMTAIILFIKYVLIHESYFRKKRRELISKNFKEDYRMIWSIYQVDDAFPPVATYATGAYAVFVAFDKDMTVGKGEHARDDHYNALAHAYDTALKRGIDWIHIDYMGSVGEDDRMDGLYASVADCPNKDLRLLLNRIYSGVQDEMDNSYAAYDVYLFISRKNFVTFWTDLMVTISAFKEANYVRENILAKDDLGSLAENVFNLLNFSATLACEQVFVTNNMTSFLRPIWTEKDGERKILNKTTKALMEERRIKFAESSVKVKKEKHKKKKGNDNMDDVDLFK